MTRICFSVVLALAFLRCAAPPPVPAVLLTVQVTDETGAPVPGAAISVDRTPLGLTSQTGTLARPEKGPEGRTLQVRTNCPSGWIIEGAEEKTIPVRFVRLLKDRQEKWAPLQASFRCVAKTREVLLVVRSNARAGLPIRALGHDIAVTDQDGIALAILRGTPQDEIEVTLDTQTAPKLRPSSPTRRLSIPNTSQIFLFDQRFEEKPAAREIRAQRRPHRLPERIQ